MNEMIYTIPEVAQYLKLSKSKVYHLVQTGQLPHIKIGKNVRVKESDLNKWLDGQSGKTEQNFIPGWSDRVKKDR
jgi:excisionase family DNA binding protein